MEAFNSSPRANFVVILANLGKNLKLEEFISDPNKLLAIALFAAAGLILMVCILAFLMRRSGSGSDEGSNSFVLESRIQALEVALMDHRNLAISLKNQSKADFAYFKQEMKNLYFALEELDISPPAPRIRSAGKS